MTFAEWSAKYRVARDRADRISALIMDRARQTAKQAGLDPGIIGVHVHNALVSLHYGRPWPEVDYSLARKAAWLMERSFEPGRLVSKWSDRAWRTTCSTGK